LSWTWAASLVDQLWRSPSLPLWVALAAAVLLAVFIVVVLVRADKSLANGALVLIALIAVGAAVVAYVRPLAGARRAATADRVPTPPASLAAMSCLDGLAGDAVEAACERPLFASAESSAAAVSYTAAQLSRLTAAASPEKNPSPEMSALRRAVERDRYGLVAHVLAARDGCTPSDCAFYAVIGDHNQIAANMTERTYEGLIGRYALGWNSNGAAAAPAPAPPPVSGPTGKPLSGDFPSSSSIPPVSIMTTEPPAGAASAPAKPATAAPPKPSASTTAAAPKRLTPKKPPAPPPAPAPAPVAPAPPSDDNQ